jgi:hypothetical protein
MLCGDASVGRLPSLHHTHEKIELSHTEKVNKNVLLSCNFKDICLYICVINITNFVSFQVLMTVSMKMRAFGDMAPCSLIGVE